MDTPAEILKRPYSRIFIWDEESQTYFATIMEFKGCFTQDKTIAKAARRLHNTAISWITASQSLDQFIPEPAPDFWWKEERDETKTPRHV